LTVQECDVSLVARARSLGLTPAQSSPFTVICPVMTDSSHCNPNFEGELACPEFTFCDLFAVRVATLSGEPVRGVTVEWANVETSPGTTCDHIVLVDLETDANGI